VSFQTHGDWPSSTVLVTGASGFLGSHLCDHLVNAGAQVHGLSRQVRSVKGVRWWQADVADNQQLVEILEAVRPDVVYHLTTNGGGGPDLDLVLPSLRNDFMTTVNLLKACTGSSCRRLVLAASMEEPDTPDKVPATPYAAAKWAASMYARMFHQLYGTPVVLARIFMTYGPRQAPRKLIPYVCQSLLDGCSPALSSGSRLVDWVYVDDVMEGLVRAGSVSGIDGQTFDLGSGTLVSIRDVVLEIAKQVGGAGQPVFGHVPDRPMEQVRAAELQTSGHALGWRPSTRLEDGLKKTIAYYANRAEKP
jgi:UDP-glucose 4-epimerase